MKLTTSLKASLCVLALLACAASVSAQENALALSFSPSIGVPGIWAQLARGQKAQMRVSQVGVKPTADAQMMVLFSLPQALGALDTKTAQVLVQAEVAEGGDLVVSFEVPQDMADLAFSVQAFALYGDGQVAQSSVVTVFFGGETQAPADMSGTTSDKQGANDAKPSDGEKAAKPALRADKQGAAPRIAADL